MSWFTESFLLLQLAPHNQSERGHFSRCPKQYKHYCIKGRCRRGGGSRRPPACKWSRPNTWPRGTDWCWLRVGGAWQEWRVTAHPAICGAEFFLVYPPQPHSLLVEALLWEAAHTFLLKSERRESDPSWGGEGHVPLLSWASKTVPV